MKRIYRPAVTLGLLAWIGVLPAGSAPRALPVETESSAVQVRPAVPLDASARTVDPATQGKAPKAVSATLGWGPPLRMDQRPGETAPAKGPGEWAGRYLLGPGDKLNISLSGDPRTRKNAVAIGPDGTLSYMQARGMMAQGKTVPELRAAMEKVLAEHHENPTVAIAPVQLRSKRYTILGKVRKSGSYPLERPITLLEAIARSGGLVVGSTSIGVTELADLRRSFVVRDKSKLGVDLERLYALGDLEQNVFLEPGDYIYIASNVDQQCFVFGSVVQPGAVPLDTPLTLTGAIASSRGFGPKAWKAKVLVVSGNLSDPSSEVISMRDILAGNARDVPIGPGDIVYVHNRPWALAEDIVDAAIRAFIQGSAAAAFETNTSISVGR